MRRRPASSSAGPARRSRPPPRARRRARRVPPPRPRSSPTPPAPPPPPPGRGGAPGDRVPPLGIEGVDVKADGAPIAGTPGVGIGALAIGNIKFRVQHALLQRIFEANKAQRFDFSDAYRAALDLVA